jgi:hypothetical protein
MSGQTLLSPGERHRSGIYKVGESKDKSIIMISTYYWEVTTKKVILARCGGTYL